MTQLHWCIIGQWAGPISCYHDISESSPGIAQNFDFTCHPETTCFVPETDDIAPSYKPFQPADHSALFLEGTPMGEELRREAATCIQAMVRKRILQKDCEGSEPISDEGDTQPCACCGLDVILDGTNSNGEYDCDMCDKCDSVLHSSCLNIFSNLLGEWSLCKSCVLKLRSGQGIQAIACDFRCLPRESWENIYALFQPVQALDTEAVEEDNEDKKYQNDIDFQPLDTTLDYVLKFLEGMHVKSGKITEQQREDILQIVKSAMSWKQLGRTRQEIEDKTTEVNNAMMRLVREL